MKAIAESLRDLAIGLEPELSRFSRDATGCRPGPGEWSQREILGHLIDSAANNHQRIVRAVQGGGLQLMSYDQREWVKVQRYNECPWAVLVSLWAAYNRHLSHVIAGIPESAAQTPCNVGAENPVSLDFVETDYLRHLKHHLKDILGREV